MGSSVNSSHQRLIAVQDHNCIETRTPLNNEIGKNHSDYGKMDD